MLFFMVLGHPKTIFFKDEGKKKRKKKIEHLGPEILSLLLYYSDPR